ncbi:MAG TPA: ABC transporter permease [Candidatus Sulfotelmatobacter sp.]|nr:ABC transporter permease [Candidatus Sulfotelmatobacter sp.]
MEGLRHDLQQSFRRLHKRPGFTAIAVLTLALGIGATTAIFSILYAVVLRPLPFDHPEQLVMLWRKDKHFNSGTVSGPEFLDWSRQADVFSALAAGAIYDPALTATGGAEHLYGIQVTPDFFKILGIKVAKGRAFVPGEDQAGKNHVVVVGKGFWTWGPGADLTSLGKTLTLDGEKFTIIGIMPEAFRFPQIWGITNPEIFAPVPMEQLQNDRGNQRMWVIGRLKPRITPAQAQAQMSTIARRLAAQYPEIEAGTDIFVQPLHEEVEHGARPVLLILLGAVGFLLLIACANVANMLLAQTTGRYREIAIRLALGAGRRRVIRHLLTESILLGLASGVAGIVMSIWLKDLLVSFSPQGALPQTNPIAINLWVLGFAATISVVSGIVFGVAPALQATTTNVDQALKEGTRGAGGSVSARRLRDGLVSCEVALALVLLVGGGLLIRSLVTILRADRGFNPSNVLTMQMTLADSKYPKPEERAEFYQRTLERIQSLPGITSAAFYECCDGKKVVLEGKPVTAAAMAEASLALQLAATADLFQVLQAPLLRGRGFIPSDYSGEPRVAIINKTMARRLWPGQDAVGRRFTAADPAKSLEVIGVIGDIRWWSTDDDVWPQFYVPQIDKWMNFVVRASGNPTSSIKSIRTEVAQLDPDVPVFEIQTMEESRAADSANLRGIAVVLTAFALIAALLAAVGIYAVISYSVSQRNHEIGVRLALGAGHGDVFRQVVGQGMRPVFIGIVIGIAAALLLARLITSFLYGVRPSDPLTIVSVALLLVAVAAAASFVPARRATRVDLMITLRYE